MCPWQRTVSLLHPMTVCRMLWYRAQRHEVGILRGSIRRFSPIYRNSGRGGFNGDCAAVVRGDEAVGRYAGPILEILGQLARIHAGEILDIFKVDRATGGNGDSYQAASAEYLLCGNRRERNLRLGCRGGEHGLNVHFQVFFGDEQLEGCDCGGWYAEIDYGQSGLGFELADKIQGEQVTACATATPPRPTGIRTQSSASTSMVSSRRIVANSSTTLP